MRLELKKIEPNPFRDFAIDPIDDAVVESLKQSIKENPAGFWGGIVCRKSPHNGIELAFGHHRVRAAIAAGIREDDIKVVHGISDADMIKMYATENATQRGNSGTAIAGTVASALRFLAKGLMTGNIPENSGMSQRAIETAQGNLTSNKGLGAELVVEFLSDVPGCNLGSTQQQMANLKASGDYARIIREVQEEIEEENAAELKKAEAAEKARIKAEEEQRKAEERQRLAEEARKKAAAEAKAAREEADRRRAEAAQKRAEEERQKAEAMRRLADERRKEAEAKSKEFDALRKTQATASKAADKAEGRSAEHPNKRDAIFDFAGVAKHLKTASHIAIFRELATGEGAKPYLKFHQQAALAKRLVQAAGAGELSGRFIRENFMAMLGSAKSTVAKYTAEDKAALARASWSARAKTLQEDFARNARGALAAAMNLAEHDKKRPRDLTLHVTSEFRNAISNLERAVALIKKAGVI
jgi:hypothetical protein